MGLLKELPLPLNGESGWPWTDECPAFPPVMPSGKKWPKISIVTPSFNQGQYIEETIRSVLLQNYPNLEYVVIDGGSSDDSVRIIKKYEPWLTYWVSEKDSGQSHAINKGFEKCSGDLLNWLCSDDILLQGALKTITCQMDLENPCWLIGGAYRFDERTKKSYKKELIEFFNIKNLLLWTSQSIPQSSVFWNKKMHDKYVLDETLCYTMDVDLWFRYYKIAQPSLCNSYLSQYRHHSSGKTTSYSSHHKKNMTELAKWMLLNLYQNNNKNIRGEVINGIINIQEDLNALKRIKNHIIIGKFLKIWKLLFNKNLPI